MSAPDLFAIQAFAQQHGVIVLDPVPDGRVRRVPTEVKPKKRNGAYFYDGQRFGVMSWDAGHDRMQWMPREGRDGRQADPAEAAEWLRRNRPARERSDKERRERSEKAVSDTEDLLSKSEIRTHAYLARKGFPDERGFVADGVKINIKIEGGPDEKERTELRTFDDVLLVPMRTLAGELVGCQRIFYDGTKLDKRFLAGTDPRGAVRWIGNDRAPELWLVEGFATGLSLKAALSSLKINSAVIVCFSAANLRHVASLTSGKRYVFADNDRPNDEHPERGETGQKAAIETGLPWCMSAVPGDDCNDLHQRAGIFAVRSIIMRRRREPAG